MLLAGLVAILAAATHLPPDADDLALSRGQIPGDVAVVVGGVGLRHQDVDGLADHLGAVVAEDPGGRRVEVENEHLHVDADYRVQGRAQRRDRLRLAGANARREISRLLEGALCS